MRDVFAGWARGIVDCGHGRDANEAHGQRRADDALPRAPARAMKRALPSDYDTNPERWQMATAAAAGDVHQSVAERIRGLGLSPVIDVGSGQGRLGELLWPEIPYLGVDVSPQQVAHTAQPVALADACHLPVRSESAGAVAALWMLYHLDEPLLAIREAHRILKPGGLFFACSNRRDDSPEVRPSREATTFDAEEAPEIVRTVFDDVGVHIWDAPMLTLADREAVRRYLIGGMRNPALADGIQTPVTVTKRGCLVWGRKH